MKKRSLTLITAAGLALSGAGLLGCATTGAADKGPESTGEYVDSSVITTKVKAALLNEPSLKSMQIGVETFKDVVQLSGFVDSAQSSRLAAQVAGRVKGVASVRNDLIVR